MEGKGCLFKKFAGIDVFDIEINERDPDKLVDAGLIKRADRGAVKVLGDGAVAHALTIKAHRVSESARQKLEAAGGSVELIAAAEGPKA